jgi:phage-related protein
LEKFREYQPTIQKVILVVVKVIGFILKLAATILGKVLPVVIRFAGFLIRNVVGALIAVVGGIIKVVAFLIKVGAAFVKAISFAIRFQTGVVQSMKKAVEFVAGIPGKITSALGDLKDLLLGAGRAVVQGLIDGIGEMIKPLTDKLHSITKLIPLHKGPIDKDKKLLEPAGKAIMEGLIKGLEKQEQALRDKLASITQKLADVKNAAKDFASSVAQNFTSDALSGTLADFKATLVTDTANANSFAAALKTAVSKGLDGALLKDVAASGNIGLAQEIAAQSKSGIADLEKQFAARAKAAAAPGAFTSNELFGDAIHDNTKELKGIRKDLAAVLRKERAIHVNDTSGDPKRTAREVVRREAFAGAS